MLRITGNADKIAKKFQRIDLGRRLQKAIEKLGLLTEREAKRVTPVDTGRLRSSISTGFRRFQAEVAPHTSYAGFVHEGTRYMSARPFLKWGWQRAEKTDLIEDEIKKELKVSLGAI